jgi:hypothetical protein
MAFVEFYRHPKHSTNLFFIHRGLTFDKLRKPSFASNIASNIDLSLNPDRQMNPDRQKA